MKSKGSILMSQMHAQNYVQQKGAKIQIPSWWKLRHTRRGFLTQASRASIVRVVESVVPVESVPWIAAVPVRTGVACCQYWS